MGSGREAEEGVIRNGREVGESINNNRREAGDRNGREEGASVRGNGRGVGENTTGEDGRGVGGGEGERGPKWASITHRSLSGVHSSNPLCSQGFNADIESFCPATYHLLFINNSCLISLSLQKCPFSVDVS